MTEVVKDIAQCIDWGRAQLVNSESPKLDAEVLLCYLLDKERSYLFTWHDKLIENDMWEDFIALVFRRRQGEPIAHILGYREFWSLQLEVSADTLIPRPDTEILVEQALTLIPKTKCSVLDLGTGTGAVALAIASECPQAQVTAIEYQSSAVALAKRNASRCQLKLNVLQGSWYEPLERDQEFSVIVSNPPYIKDDDPHLAKGDVRFEPLSALVANNNGLADLQHIVSVGVMHLKNNGWLLVEHGYDQGAEVRALFTQSGYQKIKTYQDYGSNDRITAGQKQEENL